MPLTQADLDTLRCDALHLHPHEDECASELRSRCHPAAALRVRYLRADGVLLISCFACGAAVEQIEVAP